MSSTTNLANDCGHQTLALLQADPTARGFIGACLVCGGRSLLTLQSVPGVLLPWNHHAWAITSDGALVDPTVRVLLPDFLRDWYEPPAPLEQLRPVVVRDRVAQSAAVAQLRPLAVPDPEPFKAITDSPSLLYLPGRAGEGKIGPGWQRLARLSMGPGFGFADLEAVLSGPIQRRRPQRSGQGFALEVAP